MAGQQHETERKRRKITMKKCFAFFPLLFIFTSTSTLDVELYNSIALLDVCTISVFQFEIGQFRHCSTGFVSRIVCSTGRAGKKPMMRKTFNEQVDFFVFLFLIISYSNKQHRPTRISLPMEKLVKLLSSIL